MDNFGLNPIASKEIYKDFISGKIINADEYYDGKLAPSSKFRRLVDNIDTYRALYGLLGFDIKSLNGVAFFISRADREDELSEVAANIHTLLLVICRGLGARGIAPGILFDPNSGVSAKDIDTIGEDAEVSRIIKACGLQLPLTRPINGILVERGIMYKTRLERYILSNAGKHLFSELFENSFEK